MDQQPVDQQPVAPQTPPVPPMNEQPQMPFSQPQPPLTPATPPMPPVSPMMPSKKPPTALIVTVAVIVIAALAAVGVWFAFFHVSKADYQKASTSLDAVHTTYDNLTSDLSTLTSDMSDSSISKDTFKSDSDKLNKDLATYKQQFDDLGKQRALMDKDVKQKYDAAASQNKKFVAFIDSFSGSLSTLQNAAVDCAADKASSIADATPDTILSAFEKAVGPCMSDLKDLSKSQNSAIASYASSVLDIYNQMHDAVAKLQNAYNAKDQTAFYAAESSLSDATNKFYDVSTSKIESAAKDAEVSSQMTDLDKVLKSKAQ